MLTSTIHRLYTEGHISLCAVSNHMHSYTYEYMGRIAHQRLTVDVRMKNTELLKIVRRAIEGSITDMVTVTMLYNVGYGLPYDDALAAVWMNHSTMRPAAMSFDSACELLLKHAYATPAEIYPDSIVAPCMAVMNKIHDHQHRSKIKPGTFVRPRLKGIRVYLIYRHVPGYVPHLYAGFYRDGKDTFIGIDKLIELGAPRAFGSVRDNIIIKDYEPFGYNMMYVVAGTIYTPESMGGNVSKPFNAFMLDDSEELGRERFNNDDELAALADAAKTVNRHHRAVDRFTQNGKEVPVAIRNEYIRAKRAHKAAQEAVKNSDPNTEYAAYLAKRPKASLRMVFHELYKWNKEDLYTVEWLPIPNSHLQSLGFMTTKHTALEGVGYIAESSDVAKTVKIFEQALDAKVEALIFHPSPTATVRFAEVSRIDV